MNVGRQTKIIVIEDDQAMRSLIGDFLELQGHQTRVFPLAATALEEMREHRTDSVDLIISDVNMPQMNGFEFLKQIHLLKPQVPVILISAFGNERTATIAHSAGAAAYLDKPFKLSALKKAVSTALGA